VIATAAREADEVAAVAREATACGAEGSVLPLVADVSKEDDCARVVQTAIERFVRLDVLVNNAARGMKYVSSRFRTEPTRFWETTPEAWR
jgi:NAD(P)-dependent dehydrogenase (short-subunit alcohol dehydrogenase family)